MERSLDFTPRQAFSYRSDPTVPSFADDRPIIIFDGMCVLCSGFARFIVRNDRRHRFRLLAAQSPIGTALYRHFRLDQTDYETNILLENGHASLKSEASIRIFERLGLPWSLLSIARLLPLQLRDRIYECVARNRFRWFGVRTTCYRADPSDTDRFLQ